MEGKVVFENDEIVIRYPKADDLEQLRDYINILSSEQTFLRFQGEQQTLEEEKKYLDEVLKKISEAKEVMLLAFVENKLVGNTSLGMFDKTEKHRALFGISVAKDFRGKGIGRLLMENIFREAKNVLPDLKIINLTVYGNNDLAQNLYKKFGFIEYGKLPRGIFRKGEYEDEILMYKEV